MGRYQNYELLKANWIRKNPSASHDEYQKAMQIIAKKAGI